MDKRPIEPQLYVLAIVNTVVVSYFLGWGVYNSAVESRFDYELSVFM